VGNGGAIMAWKGHGQTFTFQVYEIYEIPPEDEENVVYVGDKETLIKCNMLEDVSGWSNCTFKVLKADGIEVVWGATPNGMFLEYISATDPDPSDFNKAGEFKCTPYGEAP
jgi:hypothetical protein